MINDNPLDRIENVVSNGKIITEGISDLVNVPLFYTKDDLVRFVNVIYSNMLDASEPVVTKFSIDETGNMNTEYIQKRDGTIGHYDA